MKVDKWTVGLAAAGLISWPALLRAEEKLSAVQTALSSTIISGYVSTSAHWDLGTDNANPPAFAYNNGKQDGFNLNVVKLTIEKPLDDDPWAAGYKVELLFGPDANLLATQSNLAAGSSDAVIKQAYVTLHAPVGNGLNFRLGVFDAIIGYEPFDAGSNPNYTRSYGNTIEPTTHTGALMSYAICDEIIATVGVANTLGPTINDRAGNAGNSRAESYKTYMGSLAFTAPEGWEGLAGSTLYGGVINGFNDTFIGSWNQTSWYIGTTIKTSVQGLSFGGCYDYVGIHGGNGSSIGSSAYANATALYASYQATEKMSFHTRGEYASRSPLTGSVIPGSSFIPGFLPSKVFAVTGTFRYDLWKNVISRLEARWDHAADGDNHFGSRPSGLPGGPATEPSKKNAYLLAANIIYLF